MVNFTKSPSSSSSRTATPPDETTTCVLIAGAGPVGLATALECLRYGMCVLIIEKATTKNPYSKAFGLHARTMELFLGMGVLPSILEQAHATDRMQVTGPYMHLFVPFKYVQSRFKAVYMLSQRKLEDTLEAQLQLYGGEVQRGVELVDLQEQQPHDQDQEGDASGTSAPTAVTARVKDMATGKERTIQCKYVVGCDGSHSTTRKLLQIPFTGAAYPEDFLLLDAKYREAPGKTFGGAAILVGEPFVAIFELEPGLVRLIAKRCDSDGIPSHANDQSITPVQTQEIEAAIFRRFQTVVQERCPEIAELYDVEWASVFRVHRRIVPRYRKGNVFLAGDAAHIHSPVGGQGLNTGVHDAVNLAWKLGLVERFGADPALLLESYHTERHSVGEATLAWTDSLTNAVFFGGVLSSLLRNVVVPLATPLLSRSQWALHKLTSRMSMLSLTYRGDPCPLLQQSSPPSFPADSPMPGDRMPDGPLIRLSSGTATGLLEVTCRGLQHTLLLFGSVVGRGHERTVDAALATVLGKEGMERLRRFADVLAVVHISRTFLNVGGAEGSSVPITCTFDEMGKVTAAFGFNPAAASSSRCFFLVRPDGCIAWRDQGWDLTPLFDYLETLFPDRRPKVNGAAPHVKGGL